MPVFPTWSKILIIVSGSIWLIATIGLHVVSAARRKRNERNNNSHFLNDDIRGVYNNNDGQPVGTGNVHAAERAVDQGK
jgi:hypothetical protein